MLYFLVTIITTDSMKDENSDFNFVRSQKGKMQLSCGGYVYVQEKTLKGKVYWRCIEYTTKHKCKGRLHSINNEIVKRVPHNHKNIVT